MTKAEIASLREGPHLPGGTVLHDLVYGYAVDASLEPEWLVITDGQQPGRWRLLHNSFGPGQRCSVGSSLRYQPTPCTGEQRSAQDYTFEALHRVYFYDAWRVQPVLDAPGSELVLPPQPGLLVHGCYWPQPSATPDVLSVSDRDTEKEEDDVQEGQPLSSPAATDATMADEEQMKQSLSTAPPQSRLPSRVLSSRRKTTRAWKTVTVLPPPLQTRVIALAIVRPLLKHVQHRTKCWQQKMRQGACYPRRAWTPKVAAPHRTPLSPQSNEDRGLKLVQGGLSPRSYGNHLLQHPGNRSVASLNTSNHRLHWQTWPVGMLKGRRLPFAGTPRHHLTILDQRKSAHTP